MQPSRPQPQRSPPIRTTMWPISPAAPRPVQGLPSSTIPPPTPVPQKTPSSERYGRPAPSSNSASVATWTSLPRYARVPSACSSAAPSAYSPSQFGRLRALVTVPAVASAEAGVLRLRPRQDPIAPAPVRESDHFSAEEIERAKAYRRPQRALALAGMALDTAALAALVARPPRALRRRYRRPVAAAAATRAAPAAGLAGPRPPPSAVSRP